jgi:GntR family transcriptional regulator / MocR family aminotransferase
MRRMRRIYAERHDALCHAAQARLAGALDIVPSHSGLHTVGWLRADLSERRVVAAAEQRQITVSPIGRFAIAPIDARGLVLGFGGVTPAQIDAGVTVLADVLEREARATQRLPPQPPPRTEHTAPP